MVQENHSKVPIPTLGRLATYLRVLNELQMLEVSTVSSAEIEQQTGINAAQFRKDLSYFGEFGKPGVGYSVSELQQSIAKILKLDRRQAVLLVGAGNLGSALVGYQGMAEHRMELMGIFDSNPSKIGTMLGTLRVQSIHCLVEVNMKLNARIAILAVPAQVAQSVSEILVEAGVRAILNFAPIPLRLPENVAVRNVSFMQELAVLSYQAAEEVSQLSEFESF